MAKFIAGLKRLVNHWHWLTLVILAAAFFASASAFNYFTQTDDFVKWLSPDESANYVLAKLYAQTGRLDFFEEYNLLAADVIHPRSLRSDSGVLKPVSFLGLPLIYGKIASLAGVGVLPFLTPLIAAVGLIFFYLLVKEIFGRGVGLVSVFLLASFPPYLYYSARSFFHNVLFSVLIIISLYLAMRAVKSAARYPGLIFAGLSGSALGLAVITRSSELIWLAPLWLALWLFNFKKIGLLKPALFLSFALFALTPAFYYNQILYGSFWRGGYTEMNQSIINLAGAGEAVVKQGIFKAGILKENFNVFMDNFFHFGFQPVKSLKMFYYYFAAMFPWLFWPAALGLLLSLLKIKSWDKRHYAYFTALGLISAILLFYYGSWEFHDNPDPKSHTIGNSYTRYWLPIYLGAMPYAAILLIKLAGLLRRKVLVAGFIALALTAVFFVSGRLVLFGKDEGLVKTAANQINAREQFDRVLSLTESRAVIITRYHDKLFFPERKVIVGLFDSDDMNRQYAKLVQALPVYYYNFTFPPKDLNFLNLTQLPRFGLKIEPIEQVTKDFTLYKLLPIVNGESL